MLVHRPHPVVPRAEYLREEHRGHQAPFRHIHRGLEGGLVLIRDGQVEGPNTGYLEDEVGTLSKTF